MQLEEQDLKTIIDDFEFLIAEKQDAKLRNILLSLHSSDIAEVTNRLDKEEQLYIFDLMDPETASEVIIEMDEVKREVLVEQMEHDRISELVDEMDSDDAADFVSELDEETQKEVLENVEIEDVREVEELLKHREDSAGGIMALEIISVQDSITVDEAIEEIRNKADEVSELYNVYVVDKNHKLLGLVPVRDLILAQGKKPISEIMQKDYLSVPVTMDQEQVANFARKYDLVSVPVVDEKNRLLGRITIDDIVDVMEEEATEDIHKMAGFTDEEEVREKAVLRIVRARIPWLVWGLFGGLISAGVMIRFESNLKEQIVLAYFVPVIMAMAGNIGIQSSALVVRGLATGEIAAQDYLARCGKEMGISLLNGIILSSLLFAVVAIGWHNKSEYSLQLALLISLALVMVILIAGVLGSTIPLVLKKFGIDPALATGPFITTSNDIIGLFIYLTIATQLFR